MSVSRTVAEQPCGAVACADASASIINHSRLCQQCASIGNTCCQKHEIYVTWGDCRRILAFYRKKDFYEYRGCDNADYADQNDDPLWQQNVFRADGSRRVLKWQANGDCFFLTAAGCILPLEARPLICRLYPHIFTAAGIAAQWDTECRAAQTTGTTAIEADIAGVANSDAQRWHQLLYNEILWERSSDENWLNL
ncbi:MAG: YkgJ family cysteine cluster protein [Desulfobacteraceae bacterium]|nr:YkgJ family cysteine cluster protein [Desulfobacteraceae bacterium]